jgi:uncharacterized membrane protein
VFRGHEGHSRSLIKAVSWRTVGTLDTFIISFFVTGKMTVAGSIASARSYDPVGAPITL